jgi:SRSO17 transposase
MTPAQLKRLDKELGEFLDYLTEGMGRPERRRAMAWYVTGLLLDGERKSVVPMAARLVEHDGEAEAMRQRLQQCVTVSTWADDELRRRLALRFEKTLRPEAYIVDDTGFPKKGRHSVGVARQYSGTMGRIDNCQVAPSLHVAADETSACIGMRLYLSEDWASDIARRRAVGIPDDVVFKKKWQIAIDLLDDALRWGLPRRLMIADAGFGDSTEFRDALVERGCNYLVGLSGIHLAWPPGSHPRPPRRTGRRGPQPTRYRDGRRRPTAISEICEPLEHRKVTVPDGKGGTKVGYFAYTRVHLAERHTKGRPPSEEVWLISEWRPAKKERRYHVSNLPESTSHRELARLVKLRWRVERDYQDAKSEVGLDHFEGRTWIGFHHHATLCAAAHGFLAIQRRVFPPEALPLDAADDTSPSASADHRAHRDLPAVLAAI